jgi:hypothetical protein
MDTGEFGGPTRSHSGRSFTLISQRFALGLIIAFPFAFAFAFAFAAERCDCVQSLDIETQVIAILGRCSMRLVR